MCVVVPFFGMVLLKKHIIFIPVSSVLIRSTKAVGRHHGTYNGALRRLLDSRCRYLCSAVRRFKASTLLSGSEI